MRSSNSNYKDSKHPAVRLLPPPGGINRIAFGEEATQDAEPQHQADAKWHDGRQFVLPSHVPTYSKEQLREWGYPKYDSAYDDPIWLKETWKKEYEDPRENANFFLDQKDPEFWNNVARKPYAKAMIRSEQHWNGRKNMWLQQFENVLDLNSNRELIADALDDCAVETKRLVLPILKHRITEVFLKQIIRDSGTLGVPFAQLLDTEANRSTLCDFRNRIDREGDRGAEELYAEWESRNIRQLADDQRRETERLKAQGGQVLANPEELRDRLVFGEKCRKDGLHEWEKQNYEGALISWREGHEALWRFKAPEYNAEAGRQLGETHIALLKNLAQAAIKLGNFTEALEAAETAIRIDDQDHKAWFRKACALEGLGRLEEIEQCLATIDCIAVGRADCERIRKDTSAKRDKVREILDRDGASNKKMLQRGVQKAIFSEARDQQPAAEPASVRPPRISHQVEAVAIDDAVRKKLTKDGAEDILRDLSKAYGDSTLRRQISKLGRDVNSQSEFVFYLSKVALPFQTPVLEKWGFDPSEKGVAEMMQAIQDHMHSKTGSAKVKKQAEQSMRILYGEFYDVARGDWLLPQDRAKALPVARLRRKDKDGAGDDGLGSETEDDEDNVGEAEENRELCARHWADGPVNMPVMAPGPVSAKERKKIWNELGEAMKKGKDKIALRMAIQRAISAGFADVTIRSAKKKLELMGGDLDGL